MFFLYSFVLTVGFILMLPVFLLRRDKYAAGFWQRFGYLPKFESEGKPVIWIHCVSVGETNAARPLVEEIKENFPEYSLVVSTTTKTGQTLAREIFKDKADLVFYFPFDWLFTVRRALRVIKPEIVLIMETEIWFNFIRAAGKMKANIFIVNGRLSEKSAKRYLWIKKTMRRVLHFVDLALMQGVEDAKRLMQFSIRSNKIKVTGNIKFDQKTGENENQLTEYFRHRFGFTDSSSLIVAASTHGREEKWILEAFKTVYKTGTAKLPRLLLAPRHPERFAEVAELIAQTGFSWVKRTSEPGPEDELADVILLDSIGELRSVYALSSVVFVGGSLIPHGGQSILEPAAGRNAIVTGFYTMNFAEIVNVFLENDALIQMPELEENKIPARLAEIFSSLLQAGEWRRRLAENAFAVMEKNRGACQKTIEYLQPFLFVKGNMQRKILDEAESENLLSAPEQIKLP